MKAGRWLLLACLGLASPATAGSLYRCVGADHVPNYTNRWVSGSQCKVVARTNQSRVSVGSAPQSKPIVAAVKPSSTYSSNTAAAAPAAIPAGKVSATEQKRVDFRTAPAGGTLVAANAGAGVRVTRGAVYKFESEGVTHYTNVRPAGSVGAKVLFTYIETCYACSALPGVNFSTIRLNTEAFATEIHAASMQYGVDEAIVRAIIHAESAFNPYAQSRKGAQGLMQLIPATAARFGVSDPYDPAQNISGGVQYLAWLLQRYSQNLTLAAAAYNAGEGSVDRNGGVPPYAETQRYVDRVSQLADRYRAANAGH